MPLKIDYNKCCWKDGKCSCSGKNPKTCDGCVEICPVGALSRKKKLELDTSTCIECGACISVCKQKALSMK